MATSGKNARGTKDAPAPVRGTLGTFGGVFTPSILTILGIILFLRLGFVTGAGGLLGALLIVLLANAISILTGISLSAIATNLRVKGGGDYYVISRTLGVEYGGALGLVLFLAQSVSIAFYAIGFGEAIAGITRVEDAWLPQVIAAGAVTGLFALAWMGADWATRFQYVVMAVLVAAIAAFFFGGLEAWDADLLRSNLYPEAVPRADGSGSERWPFWVVFAIFFPAVTGFTQGVSMSGDLKDPSKSLPLGTFTAVGLSLLVYVGGVVVLAGAVPGPELVADYGAMRRVSTLPGLSQTPWLVDAGVIAATLSSALASFLGAPRILQSLAGDRVFPWLNPFAAGHGPARNPRRGVLLSAGIAYATITLGDLNLIAPIVSMFFLISYGLLNYATYIEARARSPWFRPRFRFFHERLSLAGALGCLGAMVAIHPAAAVIAVVLLFAVHQYIAASVAVDRWADSGRSKRFQRVRQDLLAIAGKTEHPRYWRPVLLAFSDDPDRRERILRFASWLEGRSGFTTAVRIVEGQGAQARRIQQEVEQELRSEIARNKLPAFPRAIVARDREDAVPALLQSYGLGPVRANTVLLNWFDQGPDADRPGLLSYGRYLRLALRFGCNVVVLAAGSRDFEALEQTLPRDRLIDVWHRDNATGRLMLLLAYLMTRTDEWEDARIRLFAVAPKDGSRHEALRDLERMLDDVRIVAEPRIVENLEPQTVMHHSAGSSVVFLPFRVGDEGPTSVLGGTLEDMLKGLGLTALVLAAQDIVLDTGPEGGRHGEIAEAVDVATKAQERLRTTEQQAGRAAEKLLELQARLAAARESGAAKDEHAELESAVREAEKVAERGKRREAGARVKAATAAEEAEALTGKPQRGGQTGPDAKKPGE